MAGTLRILVALFALVALTVTTSAGAASGQIDGEATGSAPSGGSAGSELVGTVLSQTYQDALRGRVHTLSELETADGRRVTIRTDGGLRSDGIAQYTSHEAEFTVGRTYRVTLSEELPVETGTGTGTSRGADASEPVYRVVGGEAGLSPVTSDGSTAVDTADNTPSNYVLLPYSWAWTLPDNPPVFHVNPNANDPLDEVALIRQAFDTWEQDPGSAMDWTYGGTTSVAQSANDGVNVVFWADTPDPADQFLARATTFFNPSTGQTLDTDVVFNNDFRWVAEPAPGAFDVISVGIHESGHALGLDHAPNDAAIMYFSIPSNRAKRVLSLGDRAGVAAIYPGPVNPVTTAAGRVTYADGSPGQGVQVDLFNENRAGYIDSTSTNANGDFGITLPGGGCYVMTLVAAQGEVFAGSGTRYLNIPFCATADQTITNLDAELLVPGTEATAAGRVTSADGSAAPGTALDLFTENRAVYISSTSTDGNGDYRFTLPGSGCFVVTAVAPEGQTFTATSSRFQNLEFCASAGQAIDQLDAQLSDAGSQATIGGTVSGAGGPQAGVEAAVYIMAGDGSRGQWIVSVPTGADGRYEVPVVAGCYVVDLIAPAGQVWADNNGQYRQLRTCVEAGASITDLGGVLN